MGVSLGVLSTYPPTQCGIATFTQSLVTHLAQVGGEVGVVSVVDDVGPPTLPVVHQWVRGERGTAAEAARALDHFDVAVVQHEYGIFGGADGRDVLDLVRRLRVPVVSVLHTVLTHPTAGQHEVLAGLCASSSALVTMTETARDRLLAGWDVPPSMVTVISHGAVDNRSDGSGPAPSGPPRNILTWGLLGEGKGIEWALTALAQLGDISPPARYRVVGQTHPRVLERDGELYRNRLVSLTRQLGLSDSVTFDARYLPGAELRRIVRAADVVLLPYDSREQVTSGVLTEAVAAGKPVVSTSFPHAVELLSGGAGLLVPQRDPIAMAAALRRVLTEPGVATAMASRAESLAGSVLWPTVADHYLALAASQVGRRVESVA